MAPPGAQDIFKNAMVPMVSYAATSPALSDTNKYPLFARTVPSDTSQAPSLLALLEHYGISRLGVLSFDDAYTNSETMLCPFPGVLPPGSAQDAYNYYQSLTRQPIERTFGMIERRLEPMIDH